jgi:hypothetical protein
MNSQQHTNASIIERQLSQVRGVTGARILYDAAHTISEVHVVSNGQRKPKQIIRDIESIIFVQLGQRLDHRRISLAQMPASHLQNLAQSIQLEDCRYSIDYDQKTLHVILPQGNNSLLGVTELTADPSQDIVKATLQALNSCLPSSELLTFDLVEWKTFAQFNLCLVTIRQQALQKALLGMAYATNDTLLPNIHAVFDAISRVAVPITTEHIIATI